MQITTLNQLVSKLQTEGAEYVVAEHGNGTLVQTGRFGYLFNEGGKLNGGWIFAQMLPNMGSLHRNRASHPNVTC